MVDLNYDMPSLCGPVDMRVVRFIEKYRGNKFDPSYERKTRPRVVVNLARKSVDEFFRLEEARARASSVEEREVQYGEITVPVAPNFDEFLKLLRAMP